MNFKISEFNISGEPIPEFIADTILSHHIVPMQPVRDEIGIPVYPSKNSGYRSYKWEVSHGRSGNSQHTFGEDKFGSFDLSSLGAVDWTCKHFKINKESFLELIIKHTKYTRIAVYGTFIHCDYKATRSGKRELYDSDSSSNWEFKEFIS